MKRVLKSPTPQMLQKYISIDPNASWQQMRDDNNRGGYQTAHVCRDQAIRDQYGLCAYCEQKMILEKEITPEESLHCRVEHFHPKSDRNEEHNWDLDWENMLAVCDGGSVSTKEQKESFPLPKNLSCDAHKERKMNRSITCEGFLLNPLDIPSFPNIFKLDKGTGYFEPDENTCGAVDILINNYATTVELVNNTIEILNLNCDRLTEKRLLLVRNIEHNKKSLRQKGISAADMPGKLIQRYFTDRWPAFFTTLRCCIGPAVEEHLKSINYQG